MNNVMKFNFLILFLCLASSIVSAETAGEAAIRKVTDHSNFPVKVYKGKLHKPAEFKQDADGTWRDWAGKRIDEPEINFAGKYSISAHSCGGGCRYYQIFDMTNGKELPILNRFKHDEYPPKTSDGYTYMSMLDFRADSRLLVVQYLLEKRVRYRKGDYEITDTKRGCREQSFLMESGKLKSISPVRMSCSE